MQFSTNAFPARLKPDDPLPDPKVYRTTKQVLELLQWLRSERPSLFRTISNPIIPK